MNDNRDVLAEEFAEYRHVARVTFQTPPTDGVFAAARRRAVRRRVAATIAVAGAVVLALMGTVVLQPFAAPRPAPGDPSPAAPSPTPSESATTPAPTANVSLNGTAYYVAYSESAAQVMSVTAGTVTKHARIAIPAGDYCVGNSIVVSPDGRWLAWVVADQVADQSGTSGVLHLAGLDGQDPVTRKGVICRFDEGAWSSEGRLAIYQSNGDPLFIDPGTGATSPHTDSDEYVWSASRAFKAKSHPGKDLSVQEASGAVVNVVANYTNDAGSFEFCGYTVREVSDDGRYVTIGDCATDPSRILSAHFLLDTKTGEHVTLPVPQIGDVRLVAHDVVLVRGGAKAPGGNLALIRTDGEVMQMQAEPAGVGTFLVYVWGRA